jgi:hypothetical protein
MACSRTGMRPIRPRRARRHAARNLRDVAENATTQT